MKKQKKLNRVELKAKEKFLFAQEHGCPHDDIKDLNYIHIFSEKGFAIVLCDYCGESFKTSYTGNPNPDYKSA